MSKQQGHKSKGKPSGKKKSTSKNKGFTGEKAPVKKKTTVKSKQDDGSIRLNKYISNSGICSRREADENIAIGLVTVNGQIVNEMGYKVKLEDDVRFDGARINPEPKTYVLLNKPKGFATTTSDTKGRTVMDLVANSTNTKIAPIGRLGRNSTGLLLFTNDEDVVKKFMNSKTGVARLFHIELDKNLKYEDFKKIEEGFKIQGKLIAVEEISYIDGAGKKEVGIKIKNTGNTILRTIFEHFNYDIIRLDCVAIAHLTKKDIPRGHWKHLTTQELNNLKML